MWLALLVMAAIVISWIPALHLALGDDHQGRILGRMALHADNFLDRGWAGSNYGAAWVPYSSVPYAHHPPLSHFIHIAVGIVGGGASASGMRIVGTVAGIVTVGSLAITTRKLTASWFAVALAVTGFALSGYFWFFGRHLTLMFPMIFFAVRAFAGDKHGPTWSTALGLIGVLGAMESWMGAFIIGLVALYDLWKGDRVNAWASGIGVVVGVVLDFAWMQSAAGVGALINHLENRAQAADYGVLEWIARQGGFYLRYESIPIFIVTAGALFFGLRDRRFRPLVGSIFASVVVFAVLFSQNAWVHEYWNWRIAAVVAFGLGAFGAWLEGRQPPNWAYILCVGLVIVSAAVPLLRLTTERYDIQYTNSSKAGALAERTVFPSEQESAWHYGGISGPRWLAWYADLPVRSFDLGRDFHPDDLVLVKRASDDGLDSVDVVDSLGTYSMVRAESLAGALRAQDS